eukprot:363790-Chlamydomonas_euryale.AAC.29
MRRLHPCAGRMPDAALRGCAGSVRTPAACGWLPAAVPWPRARGRCRSVAPAGLPACVSRLHARDCALTAADKDSMRHPAVQPHVLRRPACKAHAECTQPVVRRATLHGMLRCVMPP